MCPTKPKKLEKLQLLANDTSQASSNAYKAFQEHFVKFPSTPGHSITSKEAGRMPCRTMFDHINAYKKDAATIKRRNKNENGKQKDGHLVEVERRHLGTKKRKQSKRGKSSRFQKFSDTFGRL